MRGRCIVLCAQLLSGHHALLQACRDLLKTRYTMGLMLFFISREINFRSTSSFYTVFRCDNVFYPNHKDNSMKPDKVEISNYSLV
jgi:hypothetical protein